MHMTKKKKHRTAQSWWHNNSLSVVVLVIFLLSWVGQSIAGNLVYNDQAKEHHQPQLNYIQYLGSSHFWEATAENWESEFLQLSAMVVLTIFLKQKGSAESNDEEALKDTPPIMRKHPVTRWLYENSLGLALFFIFLGCFAGHAYSSCLENNAEAVAHGEPEESFSEFLLSPELWFESFQNWQSEFLAVGSLTVLSIFLRQKGSAESKDMDQPDDATGA
jgi:hypothetical protein